MLCLPNGITWEKAICLSQQYCDMAVVDLFFNTKAKFENLMLQPMTRLDIPDLSKWPHFEDPLLSWANFPASTEELQKRWYTNQQKAHIIWIIVRDDHKELIGRCSITEPMTSTELLFGVVVHPDKLGQGIGTNITLAMLKYIFLVSDTQAVWLESRHDNIPAKRTWEKIGFVKQGYHFRREIFGRYDQYIGYRFDRNQSDSLPEISLMSN